MDAELSALEARTPGDAGHPRNAVFLHEQEKGTAVAGDDAAETPARSSGEPAAEADQERLTIEHQVAALEGGGPGQPWGSGRGAGAGPGRAGRRRGDVDVARPGRDEVAAARDLAQLDALEQQVVSGRGAAPPPAV
jgi:hypothetical protein